MVGSKPRAQQKKRAPLVGKAELINETLTVAPIS
jgi:hypothetical protein